MSASRMPIRRPLAARARARLVAVVDLPTPPLPEATATIGRTPGTSCLPPGLFGLSPASLWLKHEVDLDRARALVAAFQTERARVARETWERAQAAGEVPGFWQALRQRPWHALGLLVLVLGVLFALSLPWLGLGR